MGIILFILLGLVAGWMASVFAGTRTSQNWLGDIAVGVLGAIIGGVTMSLIGGQGITGFNLYSILLATVGAFVLITIKKNIA